MFTTLVLLCMHIILDVECACVCVQYTSRTPFTHNLCPIMLHRQALTEVSVLSDVLQIVLHHPQYITLTPLNERANKPDTVSPAYQYVVKKKALSVAASILRRGTSSLNKSSSRGEQEFHRALLELRQRWRLRRLPNGAIQGDLSYNSGWSL